MASIPTSTLIVQRFAAALYGVQVGSTTMAAVNRDIASNGLNATLNSYFAASFGSMTSTDVGNLLVANLGIPAAGAAEAVAYVVGKLNGVAAGAKGAVIAGILADFSNLTSHAVYGAAATAWNTSIDAAAAYAGTADVPVGSVVSTFNLTTSVGQTYAGTTANDTFNNTGVLPNFTTIAGNGGNDTLNLVASANTDYEGALNVTSTITSVENINVYALRAVGSSSAAFDVSAAAIGATALNVKASTGDSYIKGAATTNVTVANSGGAITVDGGNAVTVNTVGAVTIGSTTKAAGAVTVGTGATDVSVAGGTTVAVNNSGTVSISGETGAVTVTNTAATAKAISVLGGTTVGITTKAANTGSTITVGGTADDHGTGQTSTSTTVNGKTIYINQTTATGAQVLAGAAAQTTGNVSINASTTASGSTTYSSSAVNVQMNGGSTYTQVGGGTTSVIDLGVVTLVPATGVTAVAGTSHLTTANFTGLAGAAAVYSNALTSVGLSTSAQVVTASVVGAHALAVTSSANTSGAGVIDDTATSFTVTSSGATATAADNMDVSGAKATSLTVNNTTGVLNIPNSTYQLGTSSTVTAVTVTANGSGTINLGDMTATSGSAATKVTSVNASGVTGTVSASIDPTVTTYAGGSGNDTLTINAVPSKLISGGAGTDTLVLNVVSSSYATPTSLNNKVSGFEVLALGTLASGTYDGSGFATLSVANTLASNVTFSNLDGGNTLNVSAAPGRNITATYANATGTGDVITLNLGTATGTGTDFSAGGSKTITLDGAIETVNLNSLGSTTQTAANTVSLVDAGVKSLVIGGAHDVAVTLTGTTALTTIDASAATGAVNVANVSVKATGATITGGAGVLTATGGAGADTITSGAGGAVITGGQGADAINLSASAYAADQVKVGDGDSLYNSFDVVTGFKNYATAQTTGATAGAVSDIVKFTQANADTIVTGVSSAPVSGYTGLSAAVASGVFTFSGASLSSYGLTDLIGAALTVLGTSSAVDQVAAFEYNGDTYVLNNGHTTASTDDSVVKLVGVTGSPYLIKPFDQRMVMQKAAVLGLGTWPLL